LLLTEERAVTTAGGLVGGKGWGETTVPTGVTGEVGETDTAGAVEPVGGWGLGKGKSGIFWHLALLGKV